MLSLLRFAINIAEAWSIRTVGRPESPSHLIQSRPVMQSDKAPRRCTVLVKSLSTPRQTGEINYFSLYGASFSKSIMPEITKKRYS